MTTRNAEQYVYSPDLEDTAAGRLKAAAKKKLLIATAESCTGGALAALLTDVEGYSHVFDRGFAVYCDEAKEECLGIDPALIEQEGAVSEKVALEMARGAMRHSRADIAIAVTGNAGPAGEDDEEGLVYICAALKSGPVSQQVHHFGKVGRSRVRIKALAAALGLLGWAVDES